MKMVILRLRSGEIKYFGPFPTFFKANEYGKALRRLADYFDYQVVDLELPVTMRVRFK